MKDISTEEKNISFPTEITFKAIFRNASYTRESINNLLSENKLKGSITEKTSKNGTFTSYTITAVFPSNEFLQALCHKVSSLENFQTLF